MKQNISYMPGDYARVKEVTSSMMGFEVGDLVVIAQIQNNDVHMPIRVILMVDKEEALKQGLAMSGWCNIQHLEAITVQDKVGGTVEISISYDGKTVWVNHGYQCIARVCDVDEIIIDDQRQPITILDKVLRDKEGIIRENCPIDFDIDVTCPPHEEMDHGRCVECWNTPYENEKEVPQEHGKEQDKDKEV